MPRTCLACSHPERQAIEKSLIGGCHPLIPAITNAKFLPNATKTRVGEPQAGVLGTAGIFRAEGNHGCVARSSPNPLHL